MDGICAPDIWQDKTEFTICELGFGTGLNFLNTAIEWINNSNDNQRLHYIAIEKHPLKKNEIEDAIYWDKFSNLKCEMLSIYPGGGELYEKRVQLTLLIGDVVDQLAEMNDTIDAWYLDGFAPSKNPEMWTDKVFELVAQRSKTSARLATFTAAGFVRRGLERVGFEMHKRPGFGKKREMLSGIKKAAE